MKIKSIAYFLSLVVFLSTLHAEDYIKLGTTLTLTGFAAPWGENAQRGFELAIKEVNDSGGINGRKLKLLYEDFAEVDLQAAAKGAARLINIEDVPIIFTQWTEDTEVVLPIAERKNRLVVAIAAGAKDITAKSPYLFRIPASDHVLMHAALDFAIDNGAKNLGLLVDENAYFIDMQNVCRKYWQEKMGTKPVEYTYPTGTNDFKSILLKLKQKKVDTVFFLVNQGVQGVVLKQAKQINFQATFFGPEQSDDPAVWDVAKEAIHGLYFPTDFIATDAFRKKFLAAYNEQPILPASYTYDAIILLADLMRKHGTDVEVLQKVLLNTKGYQGVSGEITMDKTGDRIPGKVFLMQITGRGQAKQVAEWLPK